MSAVTIDDVEDEVLLDSSVGMRANEAERGVWCTVIDTESKNISNSD